MRVSSSDEIKGETNKREREREREGEREIQDTVIMGLELCLVYIPPVIAYVCILQ